MVYVVVYVSVIPENTVCVNFNWYCMRMFVCHLNVSSAVVFVYMSETVLYSCIRFVGVFSNNIINVLLAGECYLRTIYARVERNFLRR